MIQFSFLLQVMGVGGWTDSRLTAERSGFRLCVPGVSGAEADQGDSKTSLDPRLACGESNLLCRDPWNLSKNSKRNPGGRCDEKGRR